MDMIKLVCNGQEKTIVVPTFGNVNIVIQNGKIYKVEKTESDIIKTK